MKDLKKEMDDLEKEINDNPELDDLIKKTISDFRKRAKELDEGLKKIIRDEIDKYNKNK